MLCQRYYCTPAREINKDLKQQPKGQHEQSKTLKLLNSIFYSNQLKLTTLLAPKLFN